MFDPDRLPSFDAFAKINLALHVVGQRGDGYHLLDTIVVFARVSDRLHFAFSDDLSLTLEGPEADGLLADETNLVMKAALALRQHARKSKLGMAITLEKNLPVASGIGGGSADAAAALIGLNQLWGLHLKPKELDKIGVRLGADVPMCLRQHGLRARGIGDEISPVELENKFIVLANPRVAVSTAEIFNKLATKTSVPIHNDWNANGWAAIAQDMRNDLESPALAAVPEIGTCLEILQQQENCLFARMSGSGATCFGIFDDESDAEQAARKLRETHPHWWVVASRTVS